MSHEANHEAEVRNPHELDDDEFDALEALLTSDVVPADCMDLEMLDGYLAAVLICPSPIDSLRWLPGVWSADTEGVDFASGSKMQQVIHLVLRYYNELATGIGIADGWEPFCYAASQSDQLRIGDEWVEGFAQGLELWPEDWDEGLPDAEADATQADVDALMSPWAGDDAQVASDAVRLAWLDDARGVVSGIFARWRALGLPAPQVLPVSVPAASASAGEVPGRNEPCSCGSGKKYKKCCGAT